MSRREGQAAPLDASGSSPPASIPAISQSPKLAFPQNHILFSIYTSDFAGKHGVGSCDSAEKHTHELAAAPQLSREITSGPGREIFSTEFEPFVIL